MIRRKTSIDAQGKKFIEAARALECDKSEERFDATLRKVAAHKQESAVKRPEGEELQDGTRHREQE